MPNALATIDNEASQLIIPIVVNAFGTLEARRLKQVSGIILLANKLTKFGKLSSVISSNLVIGSAL